MENNPFKNDFLYFVEKRLLPLIGLSNSTAKIDNEKRLSFKDYVLVDGDKIFFGTPLDSVAFIENAFLYDEENDIGLIKNVIKAYLKVSRYDHKGKLKINYNSNEHYHFVTDYSVQNGIANWISGAESSKNNIELLLNELDNWRLKTYEGKNVTFSFKIVDSDEKPKIDAQDFLSFIKGDFSAVLTDPTASLFVLNKNCDLIGYQTIFKGKPFNEKYELGNNVPFRFSNLVYNEINNNSAIGISLLNNGDIIISKDRKIKFVKRGNKWLNFNGDAFKTALRTNGVTLSDELVDAIFATSLDVSFSHCGGIISCIDYDVFQKEHNNIVGGKRVVLSDKDNLNENNDGDKTTKRKIIEMLVDNKPFIKIDRKLRCELSALDGACVLDMKGNVVAFGAIIQNKSGSSGGGRGAAAQRLSSFGGFAVKISTDGYLELYIGEGDPVYSIK